MIKAELIALSNGQSYKNVRISTGSPPNPIFNKYFLEFQHGLDLIYAHYFSVKLIKISSRRYKPSKPTLFADRLILDGDIIYPDVEILSHDESDIPQIFMPDDGIEQIVFTNTEGLFATRPANIASLIFRDHCSPKIKNQNCRARENITKTQVSAQKIKSQST